MTSREFATPSCRSLVAVALVLAAVLLPTRALAQATPQGTLTIVASPLSRTSGRRTNHATLNARDARPLTASRAITIDRIRVLGGGVTG